MNITQQKILIVAGCALIAFWATHRVLYYRSLIFNQQLLGAYEANQENRPIPRHISIGRMLDVAITPAVYHNNHWTIANDTASYLAQSARPGNPGNIIIYGHNTENILGNIRALTGNEIITIETSDGATHQYKIAAMQQVDPNNTGFLKPTNTEVLTLYTCSGLLDSKRFIVQAVPA